MSKYVLDNLFGSKTRVKILKFLFRNHPGAFTVRDIAKRTRESSAVVQRELRILKRIKLIRRG